MTSNAPSILLEATYSQVRTQFPNEGRRRWKLRAAEEVWKLKSKAEIASEAAAVKQPVTSFNDPDPLDLDDGQDSLVKLKGAIIRTDYSNDTAWESFLTAVQTAEQEGFAQLAAAAEGDDEAGESSGEDDEEDEEAEEEETKDDQMDTSGEASESGPPPSIFHIVQPPPGELRAAIENASNLRLLRLFNDIEIIRAPTKPPPPGEYFVASKKKPVSPNNRLVEKYSYKEVYRGRILWVYDAESNSTGSVRLINPGDDDVYGSSTGDSWRVRAPHIWELQMNLDAGLIKIDFGGEDRWTGKERVRNYEEVGAVPSA